ncbi:MAG: hypothetical protein ACOX0Z_03925 [Candidatus Nanosyncoccaceae bacterium]|jgi:hypothetical protein
MSSVEDKTGHNKKVQTKCNIEKWANSSLGQLLGDSLGRIKGQYIKRIWYTTVVSPAPKRKSFKERLEQQLLNGGFGHDTYRNVGTNFTLVLYQPPANGVLTQITPELIALLVEGFREGGGLRRVEFAEDLQQGLVLEKCKELKIEVRAQQDHDGNKPFRLGLENDAVQRSDLYYHPNWIGESAWDLLHP